MQQTSTTILSVIFKKLKKTVSNLSVNETKVTLKNTFLDNIFALESGKASQNDKTTPFRD